MAFMPKSSFAVTENAPLEGENKIAGEKRYVGIWNWQSKEILEMGEWRGTDPAYPFYGIPWNHKYGVNPDNKFGAYIAGFSWAISIWTGNEARMDPSTFEEHVIVIFMMFLSMMFCGLHPSFPSADSSRENPLKYSFPYI